MPHPVDHLQTYQALGPQHDLDQDTWDHCKVHLVAAVDWGSEPPAGGLLHSGKRLCATCEKHRSCSAGIDHVQVGKLS